MTPLWETQFKAIMAFPDIDPRLKDATVAIPVKQLANHNRDYTYNILDEHNQYIGSIGLTDDGNYLVEVGLYPNDKNKIIGFDVLNSISSNQAWNIAKKFVDYYVTKPTDSVIMKTDPPASIDYHGTFTNYFGYYYQDILMQYLDLTVDPAGHLIGMGDYDLERNSGIKITDISNSPGVTFVHDMMLDFLKKSGIHYDKLTTPYRRFDDNNGKRSYQWQADVYQNVHDFNEVLGATITYNEESKSCTIDKFDRETGQKAIDIPWNLDAIKRNRPLIDNYPAWSADGKFLWFSTTSEWEHLPPWYYSFPSSLASVYLGTGHGKVEVYRPIIDYESPGITYITPSPSPDGRWLASTIDNHNLLVIDMKYNRLYYVSKPAVMRNRVSWRCDNSQIVFAASNAKAYFLKVIGDSGVPFDAKASVLPIAGQVLEIEYVPNKTNELIAVYRDRGKMNVWNDRQIVRISLNADHSITIDKILSLDKTFYHMRLMPDGNKAILAFTTGLDVLDLSTKKLTPIAWLQTGKTIDADTAIVDPGNIYWDVSPDEKRIAFTVQRVNNVDTLVYLADMDGQHIERVSIHGNEIAARYLLQGKYPLVPISSLPLSLLEAINIIPTLPSPDLSLLIGTTRRIPTQGYNAGK